MSTKGVSNRLGAFQWSGTHILRLHNNISFKNKSAAACNQNYRCRFYLSIVLSQGIRRLQVMLISHYYAQHTDVGFDPGAGNERSFVALTVDDKFAVLVKMAFIHRDLPGMG